MINRWRSKKFIPVCFVISMVLLVAACVERYPQESAWIDFPRDGSVVVLGDSLEVVSHAFTLGGGAEALLSVNGDGYWSD